MKYVYLDYYRLCIGGTPLVNGTNFLVKWIYLPLSDDEEMVIKRARVLKLANDVLRLIDIPGKVEADDVEIISADKSHYGERDDKTMDAIRLFAQKEALIADPVYEGKAIRGLLELHEQGRFEKGSKILLMHLGGSPAIHAYANQFDPVQLMKLPI